MKFGHLARIIHPKLQQSLTRSGVNSARVSLQSGVKVRDAAGQQQTTWSNLPGLDSIPARIEVGGSADQRTDTRTTPFEVDADQWVITLAEYRPDLSVHMQVTDNDSGVAYDIVAVAWDNEHTQTILLAELVTT